MGHRFDPYKPHHPVFPNRGNRRRSKRGRFCGDLAAYSQRSRSLPTITVSRVDFWPPVSAPKNSVPGGRGSESRGLGNRLLRKELRAASENLLGIQSERFELSFPFRGRVADDSERRPWLRGSEPCDDRHRRTKVRSTDGRSRSASWIGWSTDPRFCE